MTYYRQQIFFYLMLLVLIVLHMDLWGWDRLYPVIGGWLPYEMWYRALLTLASLGAFVWLTRRAWPDPPPDIQKSGEEEQEK